ncbi:conserved hypothetical protein [Leishmania major strain Friedlin]|uniref:DoxX n=1 Tax=Leishmania major TaxID=5664 RepID=Q4Q2Y7_LEIMA|nr:conserved hypothetical protein [Leishmania major strain Friedlin]CAG9582085.1 hypothetical_protein_-_conserved [Leishmania major strain Friedlin]CAJ07926.1 conserved hypothetical protein [Leishmania major strain Friedlin]|eukprot:XP_001686311.1 conserved hypothetical protein [Leishmania major strain Friedlin]
MVKMLRNLIRYVGLVLVLLFFITNGIDKLAAPSVGAAFLAKSNFPRMVAKMGIKLSPSEYIYVVRTAGVMSVTFSLFILLGVGRSFFSFLMAIGMILTTVAFYVDLDYPFDTAEENVHHILKNASLVGALLFVTGSGHRSRRYSQARVAPDSSRAKKNN